MPRNLLSVVIAGLFAAAPAGAQDLGKQWATQGAVTVGPIITDIDSQDASKAEQYRDLSDGALSAILLRGRGPTGYWIDFYGENFGRDDMYINLLGGQYDAFKYRLYTDWLTQNRLFNGRTPFTGAGSGDLRATFPQPDPATWNSAQHRVRPQATPAATSSGSATRPGTSGWTATTSSATGPRSAPRRTGPAPATALPT